ncbi:MAG: acyl-CoA dehydrogenase, partial [Actinobacteria bacterium]|nr:acyl-CoA dehydrogenase [Actinomycetota bacterium]
MTPTDLVETAGALARSLAPEAERVERQGVDRSTLDRLAVAGLHGLLGPVSAGGSDVPAGVYREVAECLSGADGNTWLV